MSQEQEMTPAEQKIYAMNLKGKLLKEYKTYAADLEYAIDDVELGFIQNKRDKLAQEIKVLSAQIRELEAQEDLA